MLTFPNSLTNPSLLSYLSLSFPSHVIVAKYNIRSNTVCAGTVETPISQEERKAHNWTYEEWQKLKVKDVMMGRVGCTREIADATLFFACDESSYCTAAHLMVDGGQTPCTTMD
jgi:NAD(P)-dependent dehydrogenase (short-subunit alcohol dehydrogenase family)